MFYKIKTATIIVILGIMMMGCGKKDLNTEVENVTENSQLIKVGFSQLGAESDWRSANSESMRSSLSHENGYELIFEDGQQKQANQITAIRSFIQQGVDYIVLAPVTQDGWDSVLEEAKEAEIPVIIVDRMVDTANKDLFTCWVGSDFLEEGRKAAEWLNQYAYVNDINPGDLHIVNIQGTLGSSAQIGRTQGLEEAALKYGWDLREETSGDFTQAKGREVMAQMLVSYNNINVVYCENDNEALGALIAIESAGKHAGTDIKNGDILILSFDGVNQNAINYALDGTIACIVECNPLHGPRVESIIRELEAGETPNKMEYVDEALYSSIPDIQEITVNGEICPVTILTQDVIDSREY